MYFLSCASDFLAHKEACKQHSWLEQDLAQMTSILSIGILCDDQDKINEAILYFKYGVGNGSIDNAVPFFFIRIRMDTEYWAKDRNPAVTRARYTVLL